MNKLLPYLILLLQISCICYFAPFALHLEQDNSIDSFAVKGKKGEKNYQAFLKDFPEQDYFLIALELTQPILTRKEQEFSEEIFAKFGATPGLEQYYSLHSEIPQSLQQQIIDELGAEKIAQELHFPFLSEKGTLYTAIFELAALSLSEKTVLVDQTHQKIAFLEEKYAGQIRKIYLCGDPIVNYYLGESSEQIKSRLFPLLFGFSFFLLALLFGSVKAVLVSFLTVLSSLTMTMGIFALSGHTLNLLTNIIPTTIFVLTIAMQMHIFLSLAHSESIQEGLRKKIKPNFLITLTTSIGFGSLMTSQVQPIALLGQYMALAMWVIFFWSYLTHLGLSQIIKFKPTPRLSNQAFFPFLNKCAHLSRLYLLFPIMIIGFAIWAVPQNKIESNGLKYFSPEHSIRQDTKKMEEEITGGSTLEILIPRDDSQEYISFDFYTKVAHWEKNIAKLPQIRDVISLESQLQLIHKSILGFDKYTLDSLQFTNPEVLQRIQQEIKRHQEKIYANFLSPNFYRVRLICNSIGSEEFIALQKEIQIISKKEKFSSPVIITGVIARLMEIQNYLHSSLAKSLLLTLALVIFLMAIFIRRVSIIYISLIPNLFPLACMGMVLCLAGIPTTISSVMVFSIAFGIAVDDSIHFLHTFFLHESKGFEVAWQKSLELNGLAVFFTSLVLMGGFSIISFSSFLPIRDFGLLLSLAIFMAFIGDIIFLPLLLRSQKLPKNSTILFILLIFLTSCETKSTQEPWTKRIESVESSKLSLSLIKKLSQDPHELVRAQLIAQVNDPKTLHSFLPEQSWYVRSQMAKNPHISAETAKELIEDSSWRVQQALAQNPHVGWNILKELATLEDWRVRRALMEHPKTPLEEIMKWAKSPSPLIHKEVAQVFAQKTLNEFFDLLDLLEEENFWTAQSRLIENIARNTFANPEILNYLSGEDDWETRRLLSQNHGISPKIQELLAEDKDEDVRLALVDNKKLLPSILEKLAQDKSEKVRKAAVEKLEEKRK